MPAYAFFRSLSFYRSLLKAQQDSCAAARTFGRYVDDLIQVTEFRTALAELHVFEHGVVLHEKSDFEPLHR